MLSLKALQEWSKRQNVEESVPEASVDERIGVKTVH